MAKYIYTDLCMNPWYDKKICQIRNFVRLKVFEYIGVLINDRKQKIFYQRLYCEMFD